MMALAGCLGYPVRNRQEMSEIAEGDLTRCLDAVRRDEIGDPAGAFNRFVERVQRVVGEVAGSTEQLTAVVEEIDRNVTSISA